MMTEVRAGGKLGRGLYERRLAGDRLDVRRACAATTTDQSGARGPQVEGERTEPAGHAVARPGLGRRVPRAPAVRVRDQRLARHGARTADQFGHEERWRAVDAHRDHVRARGHDRDRLLDRRAVVQVLPVSARERDPGRHRVQRADDLDERLRFDHGRDRLDREHVGLGRRQRLRARQVEVPERGARGVGAAEPVVARVLGAVGQHRAVGPDRRGDHHTAIVGRDTRQLDAAPEQRGCRVAIEAACGQTLEARLIARADHHVGARRRCRRDAPRRSGPDPPRARAPTTGRREDPRRGARARWRARRPARRHRGTHRTGLPITIAAYPRPAVRLVARAGLDEHVDRETAVRSDDDRVDVQRREQIAEVVSPAPRAATPRARGPRRRPPARRGRPRGSGGSAGVSIIRRASSSSIGTSASRRSCSTSTSTPPAATSTNGPNVGSTRTPSAISTPGRRHRGDHHLGAEPPGDVVVGAADGLGVGEPDAHAVDVGLVRDARRRGLQHDGIADRLGGRDRVVDRHRRPRRDDRQAVLGQQREPVHLRQRRPAREPIPPPSPHGVVHRFDRPRRGTRAPGGVAQQMPQRPEPAVGALQHGDAAIAQEPGLVRRRPRSPDWTARRRACRCPRGCRSRSAGTPRCTARPARSCRCRRRSRSPRDPPRTPRTPRGRSRPRRCRCPMHPRGWPRPCPGRGGRRSARSCPRRSARTARRGRRPDRRTSRARPRCRARSRCRRHRAHAAATRTAPSCRPSRRACASRARRSPRTAPRRRRARRPARPEWAVTSARAPSVRPTFIASTGTSSSAARASCARKCAGSRTVSSSSASTRVLGSPSAYSM